MKLQRNGLQPRQFALPGGRYPINDQNHARNALSRAGNATPAQQATIKAKVKSRFPQIAVGGTPVKKYADGGKVKPERIEPTMGRLPDLKGSAGEPVLGPVPILPDPRPEPKVKGYADGGKVNTFRSDAEKQVDKLYGKQPEDRSNRRKTLDEQIDSADPAIGGVRG